MATFIYLDTFSYIFYLNKCCYKSNFSDTESLSIMGLEVDTYAPLQQVRPYAEMKCWLKNSNQGGK